MSETEEKHEVKGDGRSRPIVALIPAYNEERYIGSVVLKTRKHVDTVIVVDDGSTDLTAEIAEAAGAVVVRHEGKEGKGTALSTGFRRIRELDPAAVVMLDGDGQHLTEEVPQLLAPVLRGEADLVIGSRYLNGSESGVPRNRVWGHWVFTTLTNLLSGKRTTDSQSGFRAFSPRAIEYMRFSSDGFSVESEMQFLAKEHNLRLAEVLITANYVEKAKRPVAKHGLLVLDGVLRLIGQYRPLLFFGVPGLALLLAGLGWGFWVVELYRRHGGLAVGYAMISVLLTILGGLALTTGLMLHSIRGLLLELLDKDRTASGRRA
ncbi:MAG TPA: glycosyltransferase family 2 protein [Anaerolineae bacterium]|nr:glycosyltransferase family 2 protein [Anaerolineae bacterium]